MGCLFKIVKWIVLGVLLFGVLYIARTCGKVF